MAAGAMTVWDAKRDGGPVPDDPRGNLSAELGTTARGLRGAPDGGRRPSCSHAARKTRGPEAHLSTEALTREDFGRRGG